MKKKIWKRLGALALGFLLIITVLALPATAAGQARKRLLVGGMPFGVRFLTDGVLVVGYCDVCSGGKAQNPAKQAGVMPGDAILCVDGTRVKSASELAQAIGAAGGRPITLTLRREGEERSVTLAPLPCDEDGRLRTGLFVRDSGAGIGTVTFIDPATNAFGGLGHGICDGESGCLIPMARGSVRGVQINRIKRGAPGAPGELQGQFLTERVGSLFSNTVCGVFGVFVSCPQSVAGELEVAHPAELHEGAATLWCTLDGDGPREYGVSISQINRAAKGNKCFTVKVTDPRLLEKTGGIIQGMSGSPIIQNGKLVGAVTHVLIGDPTTGYGIFIENMLENMAVALK